MAIHYNRNIIMKNTYWLVEVKSPLNTDDIIWSCSAESLHKICEEWVIKTGNVFLCYHKLHNVFHNRNKGDALLINVKKINKN